MPLRSNASMADGDRRRMRMTLAQLLTAALSAVLLLSSSKSAMRSFSILRNFRKLSERQELGRLMIFSTNPRNKARTSAVGASSASLSVASNPFARAPLAAKPTARSWAKHSRSLLITCSFAKFASKRLARRTGRPFTARGGSRSGRCDIPNRESSGSGSLGATLASSLLESDNLSTFITLLIASIDRLTALSNSSCGTFSNPTKRRRQNSMSFAVFS
mmetsp:Transcript_31945/g.85541  ORF Transcript_31945/g.85541 Transcript_31945/m.85541 type:complete len:218 (+) Transcript_31945:3467-4120(+)